MTRTPGKISTLVLTLGLSVATSAYGVESFVSGHFNVEETSLLEASAWGSNVDPIGLTRVEAQQIGEGLDRIYERYVEEGFPETPLRQDHRARMKIDVFNQDPVAINGSFRPRWEEVGFPPALGLNLKSLRVRKDKTFTTMAHEMFHAFKYQMPGTSALMRSQYASSGIDRHRFNWITEGMADAAGYYAANGVGGFSNRPTAHSADPDFIKEKLIGVRYYDVPLHLYPGGQHPTEPGQTAERAHILAGYRTSSFWKYLSKEAGKLTALRHMTFGEPSVISPVGALDWIHRNLQIMPPPGSERPRFPGGLPQAFAEFISDFADYPFISHYGPFPASVSLDLSDGTWQSQIFQTCPAINLSPANTTETRTVRIAEFAASCFRVSLSGGSSGTAPTSFEINIVAGNPVDEDYACKAVATGSNGVTVKTLAVRSLLGSVSHCKRHAHILYVPRQQMTHQNVTLANVFAAAGIDSIRGTRPVEVRVDFVLPSVSASGHMSPSQPSAPSAPPAPGAPAASPSGSSTGKNVSIKSSSARARGVQRQHAKAAQKTVCATAPDRCPQIEIDLGQYDERFETIAAMGNSLGAGALVALDGAPRQMDLLGLYGDPEKLGALASELAGSTFTEVSIRLRAPEGRIEKGMRWDDAVITALVGTMGGDEHTSMSSRGPDPVPGSCLSEPRSTGVVEITDVGEGWISGTFSTDLHEDYVQQPWKDPCTARPANGSVSGTFTAPYEDITQPPVDPEMASYQVWAGLPAITWSVTDYDDLVRQAAATQSGLMREWEAERGRAGAAGGPSPSACAQECVPGVLNCPHIAKAEIDRLTPIYLETLPAPARDSMRRQFENAPQEVKSRMLAIGMNVKGCMDGTVRP